jgi:hypothetical protein
MADTKISALPASTTPLAGTEVLPIVQSGVTRQVSVANLTTGRALSATQLTLTTGNLIVANGQGVDFSATPGTGTSELLDDYEEGTWTPIDSSGAGLTFVAASGSYTKVGNLVSASGFVQYPVTASAANATIGGLPFTSANTTNRGVGSLSYKQVAAAATFLLTNNATTAIVATETGSVTSNVALSNTVLYFGVTYSIP